MLHTRDLKGSVEVDGLRYEWAIQREPQWCTVDGWKGMTIALRQCDAQREAVLEFLMLGKAIKAPAAATASAGQPADC